jgi:hypothetical protein
MIITLLLQRGLHVGDNLIRGQIVIGVDRTVVSIICVRIIAPGRIPIPSIPVIPSTESEHDAVVMTVPPAPIAPHRPVIPESMITWTSPPFASCNASVVLEPYILDSFRAHIGVKFKLLSLVWFRLRVILGDNQMFFFACDLWAFLSFLVAPTAANASARLQIETRNILISYFLLG